MSHEDIFPSPWLCRACYSLHHVMNRGQALWLVSLVGCPVGFVGTLVFAFYFLGTLSCMMVLAGTDARPPSLPPPLTNSSHDVQQLGRDITPSAAASDSRSLPAGSQDASLDEDIPVGYEEGPCREGIEDQCALDDAFSLPAEDAVMRDRGLENPRVSSQRDDQADLDHGQLVSGSAKPFQKWIRTLHKRAARRQEMLDGGDDLSTCVCETDGNCPLDRGLAHRRQSSSESSFGFVTAVKSASISMTNVSVLTRSQKDTLWSFRGQARTDRSSRASVRGPHMSQDSFWLDRQITTDPAVTERSLQRSRILEELIDTEESYIGDLRFLMNVCMRTGDIALALTELQVYVTILASLPNTPPGLRSSVNRNLNDIVELHEEILGELRRVVPRSEYTQLDAPLEHHRYRPPTSECQCWRSLDAAPESRDGITWPRDVPGMLSEPQTAAEVAKIFLKKVSGNSLGGALPPPH